MDEVLLRHATDKAAKQDFLGAMIGKQTEFECCKNRDQGDQFGVVNPAAFKMAQECKHGVLGCDGSVEIKKGNRFLHEY